ncbi:MAG: RHS repeat-associated core domain-containing protein, partial [Methylococcaceae bacterium]|nr:RHS repeat-associated core domain-containing protein [Methylococcaceae bacterium]
PAPQQIHVYLIQADHLNAPRVILNNANIPVWRWDTADAFGTTLPNEDPDGDGNTFEYNLRFPGQYYDQETSLHYNYFRDYDPGTGRYIASDPIGLSGGLNTYIYANNNPINLIDPDGRIPIVGIGLRLLAAFMPMIDLQMMAVDDVPGGEIGKACSLEKGAIALTKSRFGHTFTTHGQDATDFLINRAAGSGKPVGQFLDDQAAARLIQDNLSNLKNGAISVTVPNDVPVRIIMPDGSFAPASTIRLVPGGNGVKTAYPEP